MGAEIKIMIMPTWKGGKPKVIFIYFIYQSGKRVDLG
jgi:hypothetical protein